MRTSGAITHIVDRREVDDFVERIPDPADRRGLLVRLTRKGRALVDRAGPIHLDTERRMLAALSKQEQAELAPLLRKLLIGLEQQFANVPATPHSIDARTTSLALTPAPPSFSSPIFIEHVTSPLTEGVRDAR